MAKFYKRLLKARIFSKSYLVGISIVVFGAIQQVDQEQLAAVVPDKYRPWVLMGFGVMVCIVREYTKTSLADKVKE